MTDSQFPTLAETLEKVLETKAQADLTVPFARSRVAIAQASEWDRACLIKTPEDLDRVPTRAIVWSAAGTIACRFDGRNGVVFGDDRPFPWDRLSLPARLIWHPEWWA